MSKSDDKLSIYRDDSAQWISNAMAFGGSFVKAFAEAIARADFDNLRILEPALRELRTKYPDYDRNWIAPSGFTRDEWDKLDPPATTGDYDRQEDE